MFLTKHSPTESTHLQGLCQVIAVAPVHVHKVEHVFLIQMDFSACVQLSL